MSDHIVLAPAELAEYETVRNYGYNHYLKFRFYSKVSTRSTVVLCRRYEPAFPPHGIRWEPEHGGKINTIMVIQRADGRIAWKFNGMWGFSCAGLGRYNRTVKVGQLNERLFSIRDELRPIMSDIYDEWFGGDYPVGDDILLMMNTLWCNTHHPNMKQFSDIQLFSLVFGARKKDTSVSFNNRRDLLNHCTATIQSPRMRRFTHKVVIPWLEEHRTEAPNLFNEYVQLCTQIGNDQRLQETLIMAIESTKDNRHYDPLLMYNTFEWSRIIPFMKRFPQVKAQVFDNVGTSYMHDCLNMIRKMNKVEKALVHGKDPKSLHASIQDIYMRFSGPRHEAKKNAKFKSFEYKPEDKALEVEEFKLAHPINLSGIGTVMKICVGSYIDWVVDRRKCIVFTTIEDNRVCIELEKSNKQIDNSYQYRLRQAKMDCNRSARNIEGVNNRILEWAFSKGIEVDTYDLKTQDETSRREGFHQAYAPAPYYDDDLPF